MGRRRRSRGRSTPQRVSWYGGRYSITISDVADAPEVSRGILGVHDLTAFVEHECVLERTRGSVFGVTTNTAIAQMVIGGAVVPKALANSLVNDASNIPNLWDSEAGDDYFMFETFACVNQQATNYWNGRMIDSKAKRRVEVGSAIIYYVTCTEIGPAAVRDDLTIGLNVRHLFKFN